VDGLEEGLEELSRSGRLRRMRVVSGAQGPSVTVDGRTGLLLCSNNYLGLADDPRVRKAAAEAALRFGAGAGASRLISGNMSVHAELEAELGAFKNKPRCLLFGSGYLANTGIVAALAPRGGVVLSDELNHASIVDGCRLARAETVVYRHADLDHLAHELGRRRGRETLIVTDGVFSMDGDVAPLAEIVELARRHGARMIVDEAHATGVLGPDGRGSVAAAGLAEEVDVVVGTLGKALGSYGAYACCNATVAEWLVNTARSLIFSTALPPPAVGAAHAALAILRAEPERIERVRRNARILREALRREGLRVPSAVTPIVPVVIGDAAATVQVCERSLADGVFAQAIRPPTVPEGTSRLRLTAMATHSEHELRRAAVAVATAAGEGGIDRRGGRAPVRQPGPEARRAAPSAA
jgi:8-amino-7-oxononanoate synthase